MTKAEPQNARPPIQQQQKPPIQFERSKLSEPIQEQLVKVEAPRAREEPIQEPLVQVESPKAIEEPIQEPLVQVTSPTPLLTSQEKMMEVEASQLQQSEDQLIGVPKNPTTESE